MAQRPLFIVVLLLFFLAYIYTSVRLYKLIPAIITLRVLLVFIFVMGIVGMILFFSFGEKMPIDIAGGLYRFCTTWIIAFLYLFLGVLLIDIFQFINSIFNLIDKETISSLFNSNPLISLLIFCAVGLILLIGNIQYHNKKRQQITIASEKIKEPIRIVGISDLHIGYTISAKEVSRWVEMINQENPDMVIIAGDIIDNHMRPVHKDSIVNVLNQIKAPMGVYACAGNHDLMFAVNEDFDFYRRSGINLLRDSILNINQIALIGRDDHTNSKRSRLIDITHKINRDKFIILLDHQPLELNEAIKNGIDFQFSGHTHRGQIFPISLITDKIFELSHGYLKKGSTHFYVSSGLGIWGGKFRIGTRSEYLVLDLKYASTN